MTNAATMPNWQPPLTKAVRDVVTAANRRFIGDLSTSLPQVAPRLFRWRDLSAFASEGLAYYSIPVFHLPFWLSSDDVIASDSEFYVDVTLSTLNGFSFIRLIDDVSDGDKPAEIKSLLPACGFFHARFQSPYQRYFAHDSAFWRHFDEYWYVYVESSVEDLYFDEVDEAKFSSVSAKKTNATKIPLAATAFRLEKPDVIRDWSKVVDVLGALQQMTNDILGCELDHKHRVKTYFLSIFGSARRAREGLYDWLEREGAEVGRSLVEEILGKLRIDADRLGSTPLSEWIVGRAAAFAWQFNIAQSGWRVRRTAG